METESFESIKDYKTKDIFSGSSNKNQIFIKTENIEAVGVKHEITEEFLIKDESFLFEDILQEDCNEDTQLFDKSSSQCDNTSVNKGQETFDYVGNISREEQFNKPSQFLFEEYGSSCDTAIENVQELSTMEQTFIMANSSNLPRTDLLMLKTSLRATETGSIICDLLKNPFSRRDIETKNEIIKRTRPTPDIKLTQNIKIKGQQSVRHFQIKTYEKFKWIAGCCEKMKLYCWPCLLFVENEKDKNIWVVHGYSDLNHLHEAATKHEKTQTHISSQILFKTFEKTRINLLDKQKSINIIKHNEKVTNNRNVMRRLIDAICYLVKQETAFQGHDESSDSRNYVELLNLIRKYDETLSNHLRTSKVFSFTSNRIQNDIINSIKNVMLSEIKNEIQNTPFIAIMLDETSDISHKSQLSVVFRFVSSTGKPVERFLLFKDISANRSAYALSTFIQETVSSLGCGDKLIAQTFDGAAVSELNKTQKKVRDIYPEAIFVHSCAHVLNSVLSQSVLYIKDCKIFFATISGIASFFSTKRYHALSENVKRQFPKLATKKWNHSSRLVNTIKIEQQGLCDLFESIADNPENWDSETIIIAKGFINFFEEFNNQLLLTVFSEVFSYTDELFDILQKTNCDISYSIQKVNEVKAVLKEMRSSTKFNEIYSDTISIVGPPHIKKRRPNVQDTELHFKQIYNEILATLYNQIDIRFEKLNSLKFFELLYPKYFEKYQNKFPVECLNLLKKTYKKYFDFVKLANELSVIYRSETFRNLTLAELIQHIIDHDLFDALNEVYKLAALIFTIPFSTASEERSFSALKRIKNYLRNTMGQERLDSLSLITIEKELLNYLQSRPDFFDDVINDFTNTGKSRLDLIYK